MKEIYKLYSCENSSNPKVRKLCKCLNIGQKGSYNILSLTDRVSDFQPLASYAGR